jgi:hypothetical protein
VVVLCAVSIPQCPLSRIIGSHRSRTWLLCRADHQALLEGGREILADVAKGNLKYGYYRVRHGCFANGVRLPQAIADLEPQRILVLEGNYLRIQVRGGGFIYHFGVNIYPEDFKEPFSGFPRGDRKLIDGLWYFDDNYKWPEYAGEVDGILRRCGRGG